MQQCMARLQEIKYVWQIQARSRVDLPLPEWPWSTTHSPALTVSEARLRTGRRTPFCWCRMKVLLTFCTLIIFRLVVRVSDATLTRLIRPTGSAFVGRIRRLRRIRHRLNSAKPMTPAAVYTDDAGRRARGRLTHSPPLAPASSPANGPPAGGRRLNHG